MGSCCSLAVEDKAEHEDAGKNGVSEWFAKMCERLESVPALLLGGACLLASLLITGHSCADDGTHGVDWWNPAFATVFICGVPVLREAISSIWAERKIRASLLISIAMVGCLSIGQIFAVRCGTAAVCLALHGQRGQNVLGNAACIGGRGIVRALCALFQNGGDGVGYQQNCDHCAQKAQPAAEGAVPCPARCRMI